MFIEQISVNSLKLYQVRSLSEIQTENYLLFRVIMPVSINIKIFEYYNTIIFFFLVTRARLDSEKPWDSHSCYFFTSALHTNAHHFTFYWRRCPGCPGMVPSPALNGLAAHPERSGSDHVRVRSEMSSGNPLLHITRLH